MSATTTQAAGTAPAREIVKTGHMEETPMSGRASDKTTLPNWLMPILAAILLALIGFVYTTIDRRITDAKEGYEKDIKRLELKIETQDTWIRNMRELLIAHGWDISEDGKVTKRGEKK